MEPGGPRWSLTSQVGRGPWSTWASPVLLLCNGDTSDERPEQPCKSNIVAGWSQIRSWQVGSRSTYYSGPRLPCTSWEPALHRNLDPACCRGLDFLRNNQPTYKFYLLLPKKISPVFARLCFSQLFNHDAESVPARLEVLRIIS